MNACCALSFNLESFCNIITAWLLTVITWAHERGRKTCVCICVCVQWCQCSRLTWGHSLPQPGTLPCSLSVSAVPVKLVYLTINKWPESADNYFILRLCLCCLSPHYLHFTVSSLVYMCLFSYMEKSSIGEMFMLSRIILKWMLFWIACIPHRLLYSSVVSRFG